MNTVVTKPDTIVYTINNGTIGWNNGNPPGPDGDTVWVHPGGKVRFGIDNGDDDAFAISIPFKTFEPKGPSPSDPIDEPASGNKETVTVAPHSRRELAYVIKRAKHFPFETDSVDAYRYKYTLHYRNTRTNVSTSLDPDLEVTP
jgi:hypothetical protein